MNTRIRYALVGTMVLAAWPMALWGWNPTAGDFSKSQAFAVRVMAYNIQSQFITVAAKDAAFSRILTSLSPDIICFEEVAGDITTIQLASRLDSIMPLPGGATWQVHLGKLDGTRSALASRYPLTLRRTDTSPVAGIRGVTIALADLPSDYNVDLYLLGVHLKCCNTDGTEEADRQRSADAIAAWLGDARQAGGLITLAANTPMVVMGDFNLVGGPQPGQTLLTGDIINNATFGPDVKGDWDVSDITDLMPKNPANNDMDTYPSTGSPSSRLDRFMYTDSVVTVAESMILNTQTMSAAARTAAGLQSTDTAQSSASDHLPIMMDLNVPHFFDCNHNLINDLTDIANHTSQDCNTNNIPDECETDSDGDGKINVCDNCPNRSNPDQADLNHNNIGDACEPPFVIGVVSRKTQGAGDFDVDLLQGLARPDGIECRNDGPTSIIVTFSTPIQGVGGLDFNDVILTQGEPVNFSINGAQLTLQIENTLDRNVLLMAFPGIESVNTPGQTVSGFVCFGILRGDVNGDGAVNIFDLVATRNVLNQTTFSPNFRNDVNNDGIIDILDLVTIRNNLNFTVGACP